MRTAAISPGQHQDHAGKAHRNTGRAPLPECKRQRLQKMRKRTMLVTGHVCSTKGNVARGPVGANYADPTFLTPAIFYGLCMGVKTTRSKKYSRLLWGRR